MRNTIFSGRSLSSACMQGWALFTLHQQIQLLVFTLWFQTRVQHSQPRIRTEMKTPLPIVNLTCGIFLSERKAKKKFLITRLHVHVKSDYLCVKLWIWSMGRNRGQEKLEWGIVFHTLSDLSSIETGKIVMLLQAKLLKEILFTKKQALHVHIPPSFVR